MTDMNLEIARMLDDMRERAGEPDWKPLEAALGYAHDRDEDFEIGAFMWMFDVGYAGIQAYKHGITRNYVYLSLASDGGPKAWRYVGDGRYVRESMETAFEHVFEGLEGMGADRQTVYDDDYIAERNAALRRAGYDVVM